MPLASQWQSQITEPHLRLGPGLGAARLDLLAAHWPAGAVTLPAVLRAALVDPGVAPLRPDLAALLPR